MMHRSRRLLALLGLLLTGAILSLTTVPAEARRVSGVGLIDFRKQNFKVGDWVRYQVDISTHAGLEDRKLQELRIVGEETYRGEKCFWVETWFGNNPETASYDLSLVSYQAFKDAQPEARFTLYVRMVLFGMDEEGVPEMYELRRANPGAPMPDLAALRGRLDTLGVETVDTPRGALEASIFKLLRKGQRPRQTADSTINFITEVNRTTWKSRRVPVTSIVKEEQTESRRIQSYRVGTPSTSAPETVESETYQKVQVVDWGTGAKSALLESWRKNKGLIRSPDTPLEVEDDIGPR